MGVGFLTSFIPGVFGMRLGLLFFLAPVLSCVNEGGIPNGFLGALHLSSRLGGLFLPLGSSLRKLAVYMTEGRPQLAARECLNPQPDTRECRSHGPRTVLSTTMDER